MGIRNRWPFESMPVANKHIEGLFKELRALREQYHIPEFLCVCGANVLVGGEEARKVAVCSFGHSSYRLEMLTYALEQERAALAARLEAVEKLCEETALQTVF